MTNKLGGEITYESLNSNSNTVEVLERIIYFMSYFIPEIKTMLGLKLNHVGTLIVPFQFMLFDVIFYVLTLVVKHKHEFTLSFCDTVY